MDKGGGEEEVLEGTGARMQGNGCRKEFGIEK